MTQRARPTTAVPINGHALRELRIRTGVAVATLATDVGIHRSYLTKIETGNKTQVSPELYERLVRALGLRDRRALLREVTCS